MPLEEPPPLSYNKQKRLLGIWLGKAHIIKKRFNVYVTCEYCQESSIIKGTSNLLQTTSNNSPKRLSCALLAFSAKTKVTLLHIVYIAYFEKKNVIARI